MPAGRELQTAGRSRAYPKESGAVQVMRQKLWQERRTTLAARPPSYHTASMWPAMSLNDMFTVARDRTSEQEPLGERLVSMVFAPPGARLWNELAVSVTHLDATSGTSWDLFFVGLPAIDRREHVPNWLGRDWRRWRKEPGPHADTFSRVAREVHEAHKHALEGADNNERPWRYAGRSDLVSLMCYHGEPDWLTLTNYDLARLGETPLAQVTHRLTPWADEIDEELSPGLPMLRGVDLSRLARGLILAGSASIAADVAGEAAWELIQQVARR